MKTKYSIIVRILALVSLAACPAGAQWVRWETSAGGNGHWYRPVPGFPGLTWTLADQLARDEGGYLATLTSPAENAFVFSLVDAPQFWTRFNGSGPALGGFQPDGAAEPAGGWHWITGEAWSYSNWLPGQPDNNPWRPPEDRLHFWGHGPRAATWNDIQRDDSNLGGYVVESDIPPRGFAVTGLPAFGGDVVQSDTTSRPRLSIRPGGELCWTTVTNIQYQLQWAASVNSTDWMSLGPVVLGTGGTVCTSDRATSEGLRFYRVRIMP